MTMQAKDPSQNGGRGDAAGDVTDPPADDQRPPRSPVTAKKVGGKHGPTDRGTPAFVVRQTVAVRVVAVLTGAMLVPFGVTMVVVVGWTGLPFLVLATGAFLTVVAAFRQRIEVTDTTVILDRGLRRRVLSRPQRRLEWRSDRGLSSFVRKYESGRLWMVGSDGAAFVVPMTTYEMRGPRGREAQIAADLAEAADLDVVDSRRILEG